MRTPRWLVVCGICLSLAGGALGQEPEPIVQAVADAQQEPEPAAAEPAAPFDSAAATRAYLDQPSADEKARSDAYFEGGYWLQLWGFLYGLALAWLLLGTGLSRKMRDLAERWTGRRPLQTALYVVQYLLIGFVLGFPLTIYQQYFREHKYDLATQTFGPWFKEQLIGLAVGLVLMPLLLMALYGVFRRAPRTWWLWGTVVALIFMIFVMLIAPVYIAPLFNTYTALEQGELRDSLLSMARANGIEANDVFEFDASRQSKRISANVSGFMGTMRISLNDNLLERCSRREIQAVMGHEMGHYVLNHVYESIVFLGVLIAAGFGFIRWSFDRVVERWGSSWGLRGIGDTAGLPLLAALFSVFFFVLTPFLNTYIRVNEAEADLFGLNASGEPEGFAEVSLKLGEYRKLEPGVVEEWIFYDHPSGRSRIRMAMDWRAEHPAE